MKYTLVMLNSANIIKFDLNHSFRKQRTESYFDSLQRPCALRVVTY
jgi:hypothetical protein